MLAVPVCVLLVRVGGVDDCAIVQGPGDELDAEGEFFFAEAARDAERRQAAKAGDAVGLAAGDWAGGVFFRWCT